MKKKRNAHTTSEGDIIAMCAGQKSQKLVYEIKYRTRVFDSKSLRVKLSGNHSNISSALVPWHIFTLARLPLSAWPRKRIGTLHLNMSVSGFHFAVEIAISPNSLTTSLEGSSPNRDSLSLLNGRLYLRRMSAIFLISVLAQGA